jgi:hypothetical protein
MNVELLITGGLLTLILIAIIRVGVMTKDIITLLIKIWSEVDIIKRIAQEKTGHYPKKQK